MKLTNVLVELIEEGIITDRKLIKYIYEQQEELEEGFIKNTVLTLLLALGLNSAKANATIDKTNPKDTATISYTSLFCYKIVDYEGIFYCILGSTIILSVCYLKISAFLFCYLPLV